MLKRLLLLIAILLSTTVVFADGDEEGEADPLVITQKTTSPMTIQTTTETEVEEDESTADAIYTFVMRLFEIE